MDIQNFIENFADTLEVDATTLSAETKFRELDEWSSIMALTTLAMIEDEYEIQIPGKEMRAANTIQELFDLVASKQ